MWHKILYIEFYIFKLEKLKTGFFVVAETYKYKIPLKMRKTVKIKARELVTKKLIMKKKLIKKKQQKPQISKDTQPSTLSPQHSHSLTSRQKTTPVNQSIIKKSKIQNKQKSKQYPCFRGFILTAFLIFNGILYVSAKKKSC